MESIIFIDTVRRGYLGIVDGFIDGTNYMENSVFRNWLFIETNYNSYAYMGPN